MYKKYLLGLLCGVAFGFLVTYLHEHAVYEVADFFGVSRDFYYLHPQQDLQLNEVIYGYVLRAINFFYLLPELPFSLLTMIPFFSTFGILILVLQYYLPAITYGLLGLLLGLIYGRIKNKVPGYEIRKTYLFSGLIIFIGLIVSIFFLL